jgi:hypothetical protein
MSKTHYIVLNKSACALANFGDAMAHHHSTPHARHYATPIETPTRLVSLSALPNTK